MQNKNKTNLYASR